MTGESDPVVTDRRGRQPGRRKEDVASDWLEPKAPIEPAIGGALEEVVKLSQAGIGEAVLIELIEADNIAHPMTSVLTKLKNAGVSDPVLLTLLRSADSAESDTTAAAQRDRRLEEQSLAQAPHEGTRNVPSGRPVQRTGARARARASSHSGSAPNDLAGSHPRLAAPGEG